MLSKKKHWSRLVLILVVTLVMATTVWAGSDAKSFGWSFGSVPGVQESEAYKSDSGTTSGNHASVYVQQYYGNCRVSIAVYNESGKAVTRTYGIAGTTSLDMPYVYSVTNGYLTLRGTNNSGNGGMSGVWYP